MTETLWNASFAWGVTFACLIGAVRIARSRNVVPWHIAFAILLSFLFAALALALGVTYFLFTTTPTAGTPLGPPLIALRALSAAIGLGVVLYFIVPRPLTDWAEGHAARFYRRIGAILGRLL